VAQGERCNFGVVFTTSPLIEENNLQLLEDDENFFAVYNPTMIMNEETLNDYPQLEDLFAPISEELDTEALIELNSQVDIEGKTPANVAEQWLQENGFIS
jgi:osmoprotectant transport system substrate-binding protein